MATLITGCSQGLGYHAAAALAAANPGSDVILACRNPLKARDAVASIVTQHNQVDPARLIVLDTPLCLDDADSVRAFG